MYCSRDVTPMRCLENPIHGNLLLQGIMQLHCKSQCILYESMYWTYNFYLIILFKFMTTISWIRMQTHVYVCIFLIWTYNHANIILYIYVRFTFKWNVDSCWCMDCILMMWGNRFADYRHNVCQQKKITIVLGLKSRVVTPPLSILLIYRVL